MESKNYLFTDIFSDNSISGKTAIVYHDKQYTYNQLSKAVDLCASEGLHKNTLRMKLESGEI
mgnify:CR=1 FL=1